RRPHLLGRADRSRTVIDGDNRPGRPAGGGGPATGRLAPRAEAHLARSLPAALLLSAREPPVCQVDCGGYCPACEGPAFAGRLSRNNDGGKRWGIDRRGGRW